MTYGCWKTFLGKGELVGLVGGLQRGLEARERQRLTHEEEIVGYTCVSKVLPGITMKSTCN